MMRCVATLLGLLCLFLPATAQPRSRAGSRRFTSPSGVVLRLHQST